MPLHIFNCFDWFISRRKLFQKSFENVFEVLEKRKGNRNSILLSFGPKTSSSSLSFRPSRIPFPPGPFGLLARLREWAEPS
jgi:hypothetical protein